MKTSTLLIFTLLFNCFGFNLVAQETNQAPKKSIYFDGWNDLNKNGKKDLYEDSKADLKARVENLLAQMTLEEKTNQTTTLRSFTGWQWCHSFAGHQR